MRLTVLICCLLAAVSVQTMAAERVLYALDATPTEMTRNNVDTKIVSIDRGKALEVSFHKVDWPNVYFRPLSGTWNWTDASGIAIDIYNPEVQPIRVCLRIDNAGADGVNNCLSMSTAATAKRWTTFRVMFKDNSATLWGMRGLPGVGPVHAGKTIDLSKITAFQVFLGRPTESHTLILSHIRLLGADEKLSEIKMPFVDAFGQYKLADWPGKLKSEKELVARAKSEQADLNSHPAPADRDSYGGWTAGPKQESTGWFRTQKVDGKWWLVTPDGHLFYSAGIDCFTYNQHTFVTEREKWFEWLPAKDDSRFGSLYGYTNWSHSMADTIGGKGQTFSFYSANLVRKYGADWQTKWRESAYARLRSWGFNTIANWSQADVTDNSPMPFTACVHIPARRFIEGGSGYWGKMMDVYDSTFPDIVDSMVAPMARKYADNHRLLGYFVDNELSWETVDWATLASPVDQPCRIELIRQLKAKYLNIEAVNKAWDTDAKTWDDLRAPKDHNAACKADLDAFTYAFAHRYFDVIKSAIRKYDKYHLYLGCRFAGNPSEAAARACADLADVVSYNVYLEQIDPDRWNGRTYTDKPVIIGEFHFGAMDRGMFHPGLVDACSQQGRADYYKRYVRSAVDNSAVVGFAWFQYIDEPNTGRSLDGENYNIGFVDVTDSPYPELVQAAREVNAKLYSRRAKR